MSIQLAPPPRPGSLAHIRSRMAACIEMIDGEPLPMSPAAAQRLAHLIQDEMYALVQACRRVEL